MVPPQFVGPLRDVPRVTTFLEPGNGGFRQDLMANSGAIPRSIMHSGGSSFRDDRHALTGRGSLLDQCPELLVSVNVLPTGYGVNGEFVTRKPRHSERSNRTPTLKACGCAYERPLPPGRGVTSPPRSGSEPFLPCGLGHVNPARSGVHHPSGCQGHMTS